MKKVILFPLLFCCILFSSCGEFQDVTFSGIESVKLVKMSQQGAEAEIIARIKNPNKTAFTIYRSDLDVTLSGIKAGKANLADNIRIKGNCERAYTFRIKSDFSSLSLSDLPRLMSLALSKNVRVGLKGDLKVGKFLVQKNYPVDMSENVPLSLN